MCQTAFGCPREKLDNRYVYAVISPRARGMSVGVNVNPDRRCNFQCLYCEVDRSASQGDSAAQSELEVLDLEVISEELRRTLLDVWSGRLAETPAFAGLPRELLRLRHVTLSGDGEPTLSEQFGEVLETVIHVRAGSMVPRFKIVVITNGSGLHHPWVQGSLPLLTNQDEIWVKLDAGTQEYMNRVNRPTCNIEQVLGNILQLGRLRPITIQSLFPSIHGSEPPPSEIEAYVQRLKDLRDGGARIQTVQIYSCTRPTTEPRCSHLPLRSLSRIAQRVRETTGLAAEVF